MAWKGFKDVQATILIDLKKPEEALWDALDKDAKWGVKKAEKEGLFIKEESPEDSIENFYKVYVETCKFGGINPQKLDNIRLKNPHFLFCYKDDKLIAGVALIIENNKKFRLFLNASDHEYLKYQPNNLLYWTMLKWGKSRGYETCDLGGYQLGAKPGDKLYNVNRFKERWGGKIEKYYVYSKNPFYILGRKLIRNFRFFWWLNRKVRGRK